MEVIETKKGAPSLVVNNFKFRKDRVCKQHITWRCCNKFCKSRCSTNLTMCELTRPPSEHNHEPLSEKMMEYEKVRKSIKRKALDRKNDSAGHIVCEEAVKNETLSYKDVKSLKECVYRARLLHRPPLPKSRTEVFEALEKLQLQDFCIDVFRQDKDNEIVMLSTENNLLHLSTAHRILGDGTFKCCAKYFTQMYTIHSFSEGINIPCVFFLLGNKTRSTYERMLSMLQEEMEKRQLTFKPTAIHVDLEIATHQAIRSILPHSEIKVCNFHLGQSWYRKIQALGLTTEYRSEDSEVGKWLKIFFALPLLPANEIEDAFAFTVMECKPDSAPADQLADFIFKTYIETGCLFPAVLWADINTDITTTNACESFHRHFQDTVKHPHPNIFHFLDSIKQAQETSSLKIRGGPPAKKRKMLKFKRNKQQDLLASYRSGTISQLQFLQQLGPKMLPPRI